jgi:serine/threonine protein kinase
MSRLHGYTHVMSIGGGAFSKVYRAFDPQLERYVACKIIPVSRRSQVAEIENEARLLAGNGLACVPHLYSVRKSLRQVILVMEWISGIPLSELVESGIDGNTRLVVATQCIHALRQLHETGIAHGDLKPANVIVTPDRGAVFIDFGFSLVPQRDKVRNAVRGTPAYMAPELWADGRRNDIDYRKADLYALGLMLEQLLEGLVPAYVGLLHETDPARRPVDCRAVEAEWTRLHAVQHDDTTRRAIADATAVYTAGLLFEGARSLYASGNAQESYTLLTESLERWPDNSEALAFLQQRFSGPIRSEIREKIRRFSLAAVLIACTVLGAYISGRYASGKKLTDTIQDVFALAEQQRLQVRLPAAAAAAPREIAGILRKIDPSDDLTGKLVIVLPEERGELFINGKSQRTISSEKYFSGRFGAGKFRIEWYDSTTRRRFGETTDLLPFTTKTVSLKRFESGNRNGK